MTLSNVFSKTMRDRWLGWAITAVTLTLFLLFGMSVYREIDLTVYTSLPEAFRSLVGIGDDIDVGGLAINVVFGTWGGLVVAAIALVMGASAIAGEERDGTMDILLSNPKSRTFVLLSKTGSLVMLVALATVAVWAPVHPIAAFLGVEIARLGCRGAVVAPVRECVVLRNAGDGDRCDDRQSGNCNGSDDGDHGGVFLCGWLFAACRGR